MVTHEIKKLPQSEVEIIVTVAWDKWKGFIDTAVSDLSKGMKIDGFRPGKAPRSFVEPKVGLKVLLEEAADKAIRNTYPAIVEKEKIDAIGSPRAEILKVAEGNELVYSVKTAVIPEVTIGTWRDKVKAINKKHVGEKIEVVEADIAQELEKLVTSRAKFITVARVAKNGDNVVVDFQVLRNGVIIENGTGKNHSFVLGKGVFIPGFEDHLVGAIENDEKEFELTFPEEYHEKSLAGKPATFKVKVNVVQERQVPEINDEFAKSLGKFENLEALKKSIKDGLKDEKEARAKEDRRSQFIDAMIEVSEIDLPDALTHGELQKMMHELEEQLRMMGMNLEGYLAQIKKTTKDLEKDWKPQAEKRVKAALVLEKMAVLEEISIPSEEIEVEMNKTLQQYKHQKDAEKNIDLTRLYNYVKSMMQNEKVFGYLEKL